MASSSVLESVVHRGKLWVHIAENGHSFELDCDECTLVEDVQRYLESVLGIHLNDQLLLCMDMKLDSSHQLSAYGLPSDDREVYLFNRARMRSNSPAPAPEQVEIIETPDPPSPTSSRNPHPLDDASDPALKALPSYERQFRYHYQCGHAIYARTLMKYETCERFLREQKVQEKALEIARGNLDHFYRMIFQNYTDFVKHYNMQHRSHSNLLVNFGKDVEKLRSCKLIPSLQTGNRKCLLDFVKEENLRKIVEDCSNSHWQFENKVSEFKQEFGELKHNTEHLLSNKTLVLTDLELKIKESQKFITEQKSIMQTLSKDVSTVKKLVDDCLSSQLSSSLRPHDAVSALGPMYDVHDKSYLPKMQDYEGSMSNLLDFCRNKKDEMNMFVQSYMQKIAYVQLNIKDVRYKFSVFTEAMKRQSDQFEHLKVIRGIGPAYRACLAEIVRRKASMKLYMGMAGQLAEQLATKREAEVRRREEFLKVHSLYIPRDILTSMGLYDTPSHCDVNIAPFDTSLLDIDISDIERYAPEYLVGLFSKSEKHGSLKGSFSLSHDSFTSEVEDSSLDATDRYSSDEILEAFELEEIAGTSKMEVENSKLKAELASAMALICSYCSDVEYESLDDSKVESLLKDAAEKTAQALHLKDEYEKHLISMLKNKQMQCESYEKRIQELEQRLSDQNFVQEHKFAIDKNALSFVPSTDKADYKSEVSGEGEALVVSVAMDDLFSASNSEHVKSGVLDKHGKPYEGLDENMTDSSGILSPQLDSSMVEPLHDYLHSHDKDCKETMLADIGMGLATSSTADSMSKPPKTLLSDMDDNPNLDSERCGELLLELRHALAEKSSTLAKNETKLDKLMEEILKLERELEISRKILDESQMNCAHLENCLHEAREEAQTHLYAAERRASEYSALRASAVKMNSHFERLKTCMSSGSMTAIAESLRALSQSLANSAGGKEDDGTTKLRECIHVLAGRVGDLSRHRADLLDRHSKAEAASDQLTKELEERKELVNTLYMKHQSEKQATKDKISFGRLEVHELAAFIFNSAGHYEAINGNCHHYYLSTESVALFADHLPQRPSYIIGQIVHIERLEASPVQAEHNNDRVEFLTTDTGSSVGPYDLPIGCEYFIVTIAMLPETTIRSQPTS
ncbi:Autophagy-related protein 11 [Heracleum sosnowskyi]|uniref:Autophagy-related protein 11 n=1 Tax=Heracleum sosnowskyi TaxID=360622 RepID=A0AAD8MAP1_9APIA|nr:Autophagy-related protein 11 [Heracleum sosnowskyi]